MNKQAMQPPFTNTNLPSQRRTLVSVLLGIFAFACLFLLTPQAHAAQGVTILTVGSGLACDYSTIQAAIDAAPPADITNIRIEGTTFNEALVINDKDITLSGGYSFKCNNLSNGENTIIDGAGLGKTVIDLVNATQDRDVRLSRLIVRNGSAVQGGGVAVSADFELFVSNSRIQDNSATDGGGIYVDGGSVELFSSALVLGNTASGDGGGIHCAHNGLVWIRDGAQVGFKFLSAIAPNVAGGDGGGVYSDSCRVWLDDGVVVANSATRGGGVALSNGANLEILAGGDIVENSAVHGGGVYATTGGNVLPQHGSIAFNTASLRGGGVYLDSADFSSNRATFSSQRNNASCANTVRCIELSNNSAPNGGGIYSQNSLLGLFQIFIENNSATVGEGAAVYSNMTTAAPSLTTRFLVIGDAVLAQNDSAGQHTVYSNLTTASANRWEIVVNGATILDNSADAGLAEFGLVGAAHSAEFSGSVIGGDGSLAVLAMPSGAVASATCNWVPNGAEATFQAPTNTAILTPANWRDQFVDAAAGDFRPNPFRFFIDKCEQYDFGSTLQDIVGQPRGWDHPALSNSAGKIWDIGAFEAQYAVGVNGADCAYRSINDALAAAQPDDTIYIGGNSFDTTYTENLIIDHSVTLLRANVTCRAALHNANDLQSPDYVQKVIIDGSGAGSRGSTATVAVGSGVTVTLQGLELHNGSASFGGNLISTLGSTVVLSETTLFGGTASTVGGGAYVNGVLVLQNGSRVLANAAINGGGLATIDNGFIDLQPSTIISGNVASGDGGGLYASGGATLSIEAGVTIRENSAEDGGGVALVNGGVLRTLGGELLENEASRYGGGIYANSADVRLFNTHVNRNSALAGGGIASQNSNGFAILPHYASCDPEALGFDRYCSEINNNNANSGAGIWVQGGDLGAIGTAILGNRGDGSGSTGAGLQVQGLGSVLMRNVLWTTNGQADSIIEVVSNSSVELRHNTLALNAAPPIRAAGNLTVSNSIVWSNPTGIDMLSGSVPALSCNTLQAFVSGGAITDDDNPQFANRGHSFFQLADNSPAIDQCANDSQVSTDILGHRRQAGSATDQGVFETGSDALPTVVQLNQLDVATSGNGWLVALAGFLLLGVTGRRVGKEI